MRRRVVIIGQVQGVFFREATRRRADSLGVSGWVRNRDDGTVEAVLEGGEDDVERMVAFCRQGPGDAAVEGVEVATEDEEGLSGFSVR